MYVVCENRMINPADRTINANPTRQQLAERAAAVLLAKGPMLEEYFRIKLQPRDSDGQQEGDGDDDNGGQGVGTDGFLTSLPDLLPNYTPSPEAIPLFLLRMATEVGRHYLWVRTKETSRGMAHSTAFSRMCTYIHTTNR